MKEVEHLGHLRYSNKEEHTFTVSLRSVKSLISDKLSYIILFLP